MSYSPNRKKPPLPVRRKPASSPYGSNRARSSGQNLRKKNFVLLGFLLIAVLVGVLVVLRLGNSAKNENTTSSAQPSGVVSQTQSSANVLSNTTGQVISNTQTFTQSVVVDSIPLAVSAQQQLLLDLLNEQRELNGLPPLQYDAAATISAQAHAQEMVDLGYLSNWNIDGYGPDYRYSRAGGLNAVAEAVYSYEGTSLNGSKLTEEILRAFYQQLKSDSAFITHLTESDYTQAGIGIAAKRTDGIKLVISLVRRYVDLNPVPVKSQLGTRITLRGQLLSETSNPRAELTYEPFPAPLSLVELNNTNEYLSSAAVLADIPLTLDQTGGFQGEVVFSGSAGLYHLRVFVDVANQVNVEAANIVIEVR